MAPIAPRHLGPQPVFFHVSHTRLIILCLLERSMDTPLAWTIHMSVTYNAGCTWRVVHPHPVGTVVRVKVLATILVEASAATHLHFHDKAKYKL